MLEKRYNLSEADASTEASYVLAGSMILYPIVSLISNNFRTRLKLKR